MIEIRDVSPHAWAASGWATTWSNSPERGAYFVNDPREGTFLERMQRGVFQDAVTGRDSVELRREHDQSGPVFASTNAGSLRLDDRSDGLMLGAALSKRDPATRTAVEDVRAGHLGGLSVGMIVRADDWSTAADGRTALRTITSATLNEVSMVRRPANPEATILDIRHEQRSGDRPVEYRSVPLAFDLSERQWANQHGQECDSCGGTGECPDCDGQGWTSPDGTDGRSEPRRDFTAAQLQSLGKAGKAIWIDGHWAYPTPMRSDYDNAVQAIGRTPGRNRQTVRKYLMGRAKQESWPIPSSWNSDGSTNSDRRCSSSWNSDGSTNTAGRSVALAYNDTETLMLELLSSKHRPSSSGRRSLLDPNDTDELESELWRTVARIR